MDSDFDHFFASFEGKRSLAGPTAGGIDWNQEKTFFCPLLSA
jgi:hypothetical protein